MGSLDRQSVWGALVSLGQTSPKTENATGRTHTRPEKTKRYIHYHRAASHIPTFYTAIRPASWPIIPYIRSRTYVSSRSIVSQPASQSRHFLHTYMPTLADQSYLIQPNDIRSFMHAQGRNADRSREATTTYGYIGLVLSQSHSMIHTSEQPCVCAHVHTIYR